jgi:hypothetical protein
MSRTTTDNLDKSCPHPPAEDKLKYTIAHSPLFDRNKPPKKEGRVPFAVAIIH